MKDNFQKPRRFFLNLKAALYVLCLASWAGFGGQGVMAETIILQSTTSTANSGLLDDLLPRFTAKTGINVKLVAVGTGQAIKNAKNGDGDLLLVHDRQAEEEFVAAGYGEQRIEIMYNDFVLIGPATDPALIGGAGSVTKALSMIEQAGAVFLSRGDESGTHKKELRLWQATGVTPKGDWYRDVGSGMGATLQAAIGMDGYTLTDRASWLAFAHKADHKILYQGDENLFNQYSVIIVNKTRHPHVKAAAAQSLADWLVSAEGQAAINGFRVGGQQLFFANAK